MSHGFGFWFWRAVAVLVGLLILGQLIRPARTNPPETAALTLYVQRPVPPAIRATLERSCRDCHSYRTHWPWYSNVAPASWLLASDVKEGREDFNLSTWGSTPAPQRDKWLQELCDEVSEGDMPPWYYLLAHRHAKLADADRQALCAWAGKQPAKGGESEEHER